eukprot:jgi/Orpsp1_1/1183517/evm.model.c7180000085575.1
MERLAENGIQDSSIESFEKRRKIIKDNDELLEEFLCNIFYIDKSLLIKEFLNDNSTISCVTRPPNCGKTVNINMLRCFFEMNYENENIFKNKKHFEKLNIAKEFINGERYIDLYQGQFPVVYLDFNDIYIEKSFKETINSFKYFIHYLYDSYPRIIIENLDNYEKEIWINFLK